VRELNAGDEGLSTEEIMGVMAELEL